MNLFAKIMVLASTFLYVTHALSQSGNFKFNNQIKISPLRIVDLINPGIELGYEKFHGEKYSSQVSFGYMTDIFNITPYNNYKGLRTSFEEKYFLQDDKTGRYYVSGEFVFLKAKYEDFSWFVKDSSLEYRDAFDVSKNTFSINLKVGMEMPFKPFMIDIYVGLGIKYKTVKRNGIDDINANEITPRHPNAYYMASANGNYFTLSLPVNIKIGYAF